jgi:hypothetical protein
MIEKKELKRFLDLTVGKKCINCKLGIYVTKSLICDNCGDIFSIKIK